MQGLQQEPVKFEEISGKIDKIIFYSPENGFFCAVILTGNKNITVSGNSAMQPSLGSFITAKGNWFQHPKFGNQFKITEFKESFATDRTGTISFLKQIEGIGDIKARKIADKLGNNCLQSLAENPSSIIGFSGISEKLANSVSSYINSKLNSADIESTLAAIGAGPKTRSNAIKEFGSDTIKQWIQENPYLLIQIPRITFSKVDAWVLATKRLDQNSTERGAAVAIESLNKHCAWGHTWAEFDQVIIASRKLKLRMPISEDAVKAGINYGIEKELLSKVEHGGIALTSLAEAENNIAITLNKMLSCDIDELGSFSNLPSEVLETLTDEQKQAVTNAIKHRVSGITGYPGTGKTFVARAILKALGANCYIVAPTGKAAKRATEVTGYEASTIHRFIGKAHSIDFRIPQVLLIDEASMVDVSLFSNFLDVIQNRSDVRIIIMGDVDQLPSISPGNVLGDLIDSEKIPFVRLIKIQRQKADSNIIKNALVINSGESDIQISEGEDFIACFENDPEKLKERIIKYFTEKLPQEGLNPIKDAQLIVGQRTSILGTNEMNESIREIFNPSNFEKAEILDKDGKSLLRVSDKVMVTENNYQLGVVNGDQGIITEIILNKNPDKNKVTVNIDGIGNVVFENGDISSLVQAWAITVHRYQGSESPIVLTVCHSAMAWARQRALLYTAITRGKQRVVLFGTSSDIQKSASTPTPERYTRLRNLLVNFN